MALKMTVSRSLFVTIQPSVPEDEREEQAPGKLQHPNCVTIRNFGQNPVLDEELAMEAPVSVSGSGKGSFPGQLWPMDSLQPHEW